MTSANRGLGRGLDALLGGVRADEKVTSDSAEVRMIAIDAISPNPHQPRRVFPKRRSMIWPPPSGRAAYFNLSSSAPSATASYELVAGERRLRASKIAGMTEIPTLIRDMTDQESLAIALIENLQREDLNAVEEALGYQQLQQEFGLSQEELARQVGKSRSTVANALRLLNLPEVGADRYPEECHIRRSRPGHHGDSRR